MRRCCCFFRDKDDEDEDEYCCRCHDVIFHIKIKVVCFDAEEKGLLGSKYYVKNPARNISNTAMMVNMDMIGRLNDKPVILGGVGSSGNFENIIANARKNNTLDIEIAYS